MTPERTAPPPLISVVTITYNAGKVLERTIQSLVSQTFRDYEYLLIDGASKDDTLQIAEKYRQHIHYLVSEPDKGIYDAMNKGLQAATGKYIWFMNAGDEFFDSQTLAHVFAENPEADVLYGNALFVNEDGSAVGLRDQVTPHRLPENLTWHNFRYGMVVCHQAFVVRRELAPLYDLSHPYSADIDWEIRCLKKTDKIFNTRLTLCKYLTGGFSKKHLQQSLQDRYLILQNHFGVLPNLFAHAAIGLRGFLFSLLHK